jgi:hypothetical protein
LIPYCREGKNRLTPRRTKDSNFKERTLNLDFRRMKRPRNSLE